MKPQAIEIFKEIAMALIESVDNATLSLADKCEGLEILIDILSRKRAALADQLTQEIEQEIEDASMD